MKYDVYDLDTGQWSCWDSEKGWLCPWMNDKAYLRWYSREYGVTRFKLPTRNTILKADADDMERRRIHGKG